jgi:hypothetical protein
MTSVNFVHPDVLDSWAADSLPAPKPVHPASGSSDTVDRPEPTEPAGDRDPMDARPTPGILPLSDLSLSAMFG